jgi:hypothetical protein
MLMTFSLLIIVFARCSTRTALYMSFLSRAVKLITFLSILEHSASQSDQTRLLGSSFGVAGTDRVFDYVVNTHGLWYKYY